MQTGKRLVGKVAIVTGGASGIGAETARAFGQHGAKVLLTDTNAALGKSVAKVISEKWHGDVRSSRRLRRSAVGYDRNQGREELWPARYPVQYRRHLRPRSENECSDERHRRTTIG